MGQSLTNLDKTVDTLYSLRKKLTNTIDTSLCQRTKVINYTTVYIAEIRSLLYPELIDSEPVTLLHVFGEQIQRVRSPDDVTSEEYIIRLLTIGLARK